MSNRPSPVANNRWVKNLVAGLVVLGLSLSLGADLSMAGTAKKRRTTTTRAAASAKPTTFELQSRVATFVDPSRPTASTTASAKKPMRELPTLILTPVAKSGSGKFPLLVFGHGLGGDPAGYDLLLRAIARSVALWSPRLPSHCRTKTRPAGRA
jgi:hypothetical protein